MSNKSLLESVSDLEEKLSLIKDTCCYASIEFDMDEMSMIVEEAERLVERVSSYEVFLLKKMAHAANVRLGYDKYYVDINGSDILIQSDSEHSGVEKDTVKEMIKDSRWIGAENLFTYRE